VLCFGSYTSWPELVNEFERPRAFGCRGPFGASQHAQLHVECRQNQTEMDSIRDLGKLLIVCGLALAVAGVFLFASGKVPFRLGHLPGDISYKGSNSSFYFPFVTCLLLSVILSMVMWLVNYFRR
jgi:hypothetical protein